MEGVKNIIVVASGKGGVGKSTVAVNLAIALSREGMNTALVDADIFGPSIPRMLGIEDAQPDVSAVGDKEIFFPVKKYGISIISVGFFINRSQSLIWRGPMAGKAVTQLLEDTQWGDIDYMIIDFPPGTSDIQLTTVQKLNLNGAIIVTTPQEFDTQLLGQIPLVMEVGESAEQGLSVFSQKNKKVVDAFEQIAEKIINNDPGK
jgi:ATP-binding protein involved in chromosome partitioning